MISNIKQDVLYVTKNFSHNSWIILWRMESYDIFITKIPYLISGKISGDEMTEFARARPASGAKL